MFRYFRIQGIVADIMDRIFIFKTLSYLDRRSTIELIISICIIIMLSGLAINFYYPSGTKSRLTEAYNVFSILKQDVTSYYGLYGKMPNSKDLSITEKYLTSDYYHFSAIDIEDGAITFTLKDEAFDDKSNKLSFRPAFQKDYRFGTILWLCGYAEPVSGTYVTTKNHTSLDRVYLSNNCKGRI